MRNVYSKVLLLFLLLATHFSFAQNPQYYKMSNRLYDQVLQKKSSAEYLKIGLLLSDRVDVLSLDKWLYEKKASPEQRAYLVINALKTKAANTQPALIDKLQKLPGVEGASIEPYWISNLIFISAQASTIEKISALPEVEFIDINAQLKLDPYEIERSSGSRSVNGHEPGHDAIGAPQMWAMGYTGLGRIAAGFDTGVNISHPSIGPKWLGHTRPLGQSWYAYPGGAAQPSDCDPHGTHTVGTMVGLDPATNDTIGVAFNGNYIGSNNLCTGGTASNIAAFQWSVDPDSNATTTTDMPDAICNSWYDPGTSNECNGLYKTTFDAVEAVGIAIVFSAGNSGSGSSTITMPKNINTDTVNVFCVGNINGNLSSFPIATSSSRGPSDCGGTGSLLIKPEVVAPGTSVRSCINSNGYANYTGTSMAAPHVCGAILLLKEAFPTLTGRQIKMALYLSAIDLGTAGEDNTYGMGLINIPAAYNYLISQGHTPQTYANDASASAITAPGGVSCVDSIAPVFTLKNFGSNALTSATITYTLTPGGSYTYNWTGNLSTGASAQVNLPAIAVLPGSYLLTVATSNPNNTTDDRANNDEASVSFDIEVAPVTTDAQLNCPGTATLTATNPGIGQIRWYDALTGGTQIGTGSPFTTPYLNNSTTYYADAVTALNTGEPNNSQGTGGYFANTNRYIEFNCFSPFRLKSVLVYADGTGNRTIELRNSSGFVLDSRTINMSNGQQRVTLDFDVQPGNGYQLATSLKGDMYRNSSGLSYPYTVPGVLEIYGSNASNPTSFYYFYYDWEIEYGNRCGRTPAIVTVSNGLNASFTPSATTVNLTVSGTVNFTDNTPGATAWSWTFGDGGTSSLQNPSHTYTNVGTYTVTLVATDANGCTDSSSTNIAVQQLVGVDPGLLVENVQLSPNPSNGVAWLSYELTQVHDLSVRVFDPRGKLLLSQKVDQTQQGRTRIDLGQGAPGLYLVEIQVGEQRIVKKLLRTGM